MKKIISASLAVALLAGALFSCAKKTSGENPKDKQNKTDKTVATTVISSDTDESSFVFSSSETEVSYEESSDAVWTSETVISYETEEYTETPTEGTSESAAVTETVPPETAESESTTLIETDPPAEVTSEEETQSSEEADPEVEPLETFNGWWKHIGDNVAGVPMVEIIHIEAEKGLWTEYSAGGIKGGTFRCYTNEWGLNLEYGDIGVTILLYDGISLLNYSGYIEYIPCDPIEEVSPTAYEGKWYELGDADGAYYEIKGKNCTYNGSDKVAGTWSTETVTTVLENGDEIEETVITVVCGKYTKKLVVADKGGALYDPESNNAYIIDRDLDTIRGDDLVKKYDLICHRWIGEEDDIVFGYYGKEFYIVSTDDNGAEIKELGGTWSIHEFELNIHYADGQEEITGYDTEVINFSYLGHADFRKETK